MGVSGVTTEVQHLLSENGWAVIDAYQMSLDPWPYRDYIRDWLIEMMGEDDERLRVWDRYCRELPGRD